MTMRRRSRGFTLIEVVVAFVMLALVLSVSFEIFTGGLKRAGELEDYSQALLIAQSKLSAAGTEKDFKEGQSQGDSDDRRFHWTVAQSKTDEGLPPDSKGPFVYVLYRVDVKVDWHGGDGHPHSLGLSTLGMGSGL
jgi:general secretion pathway protein I